MAGSGRESRRPVTACGLLALVAVILPTAAPASADNLRLNKSVFNDILIAQANNGCPISPRTDPKLTDAARRHSLDVRDNQVDGHIGSDGSTAADRVRDSGFVGKTAETIAISPSVAISGIAIVNQWWNDPESRAIMQDCSNTAIGVWSENSPFRTALVAVYGQPGMPQ